MFIIYICKHRKIHSAYDVTSGLKSFATIQFIIYYWNFIY